MDVTYGKTTVAELPFLVTLRRGYVGGWFATEAEVATMSVFIQAVAGRHFRLLDLPEAEVLICPDFFRAADADRLLRELLETTTWRQEVFKMYGKEMPFPRLTTWCGDVGTSYTYSGL
jgi:hypothetical protein